MMFSQNAILTFFKLPFKLPFCFVFYNFELKNLITEKASLGIFALRSKLVSKFLYWTDYVCLKYSIIPSSCLPAYVCVRNIIGYHI